MCWVGGGGLTRFTALTWSGRPSHRHVHASCGPNQRFNYSTLYFDKRTVKIPQGLFTERYELHTWRDHNFRPSFIFNFLYYVHIPDGIVLIFITT